MNTDAGLIAAWDLRGDARDGSGNGHHGHPGGGVDFGVPGPLPGPQPGGAAGFDGRGAQVTVPDAPGLRLGAGDFSIVARVRVPQRLDDGLGDLCAKFDPGARRGFALGLLHLTGVTSHQPNSRQVYFGVDAGSEPVWEDAGRPGNAVLVKSLAVHAGDLYAGTYEAGAGESGRVYRYAGGTRWEDCGAPDRCNAVTALAVHAGDLYAGVSRYKAGGSSLPESPNPAPGGRVYRYAGGVSWEDGGPLDPGHVLARAGAGAEAGSPYRSPVCDSVAALAVYGDALYAIPMYSEGLFRHAGGTRWVSCGTPGYRLMALGVFDGALYAAGNQSAGVLRYDGGEGAAARWTGCGRPAGVSQVYSFAVYGGRLHAGTWPEGRVFRYDGGETWTDCGRLGEEQEVMGMAAYNGKLYAGTLPLAEVYRYDPEGAAAGGSGGSPWTRVGRLDRTPDVRYRRVWSMAQYGGRLFAGTLPSGRVAALRAGAGVTTAEALAPGWRHVVAVRQGGRLSLYVDGREAAAGGAAAAPALDVSTAAPLRLGAGPHDFLYGSLAGVRLYGRALDAAEVAGLAARGQSAGD